MEPTARVSSCERSQERARRLIAHVRPTVPVHLRSVADGVQSMTHLLASGRSIVVKTMVTHTVTYFAAGVVAFSLFDYPALISRTALRNVMRPLDDPMVMAGPTLQPVRGVLFGVVFYFLRETFFARHNGWVLMWMVLVSCGILGTLGHRRGRSKDSSTPWCRVLRS